ncbi:MAG: hypothetical protein U0Q11_22580 [Vicinamibacterales bacterium]
MGFAFRIRRGAIADVANRGGQRYGLRAAPAILEFHRGDLGGYAPPACRGAGHPLRADITRAETRWDTISTPGLERAARFYRFFVDDIAQTPRAQLQR